MTPGSSSAVRRVLRPGDARATWKAGHAAARFNSWGKRCAEAIRLADRGDQPVSYS